MKEWMPKRFWKSAKVEPLGEGFGVFLDERVLKTPAKQSLIAPSIALAETIAQEWRDVEEVVDPAIMHNTRMANSAIDTVASNFDHVVETLAAYSDADLLCYRALEPPELLKRQETAWDPFLKWSEQSLGAPLFAQKGVMHVAQPPQSISILRTKIAQNNAFGLAALHDLITLTGSCVLGLVASAKARPVEEIWQAATVDERWSIDTWGADEELVENVAFKEKEFFSAYSFFHLI